MSKKNDDSVEQFFRKAVAQQDDTFMQRDWEKMEKLLDAEAAKATVARFQRIKKAIFRGAAVITIVAVVYFLMNDKVQHPESRLLTDALVKEQAVAGAEAPTTKPKEIPSTASLFSKSTEPESKNDLTNKGGVLYKQKDPSIKNRIAFLSSQSETIEVATPIQQAQAQTVTGENLNFVQQQNPNENPNALANVVRDQPQNDLTNNLAVVEEGGKDVEKKALTVTPESAPVEGKLPDGKKKSGEKFSRWNIALSFAPDFSTTELNRYSAPGDAYGLNVGFNISRRLVISTGVLKTSKRYEGYGSEYQPPYGYWDRRTNGVIPDEVKGNCTVLEFPVNIQYQINRGNRNRVFASMGISSYYMLDEAYYYQFEEPNPGAAESWSSDVPSSYAFSIGHLSAAYERQLSPNFSIGIEPFLKIPFSGIGWTNIELFTTGAYVNVRYRFTRKTTDPDHVRMN